MKLKSYLALVGGTMFVICLFSLTFILLLFSALFLAASFLTAALADSVSGLKLLGFI